MIKEPIFITGIDTDAGKTITSAIMVESLQADYWKPIQCGDLENSDSLKVKSLINNDKTTIHKEAYKFLAPESPHKAADLENKEIDIKNIIIPATENSLVIEGAGGLMVPLNKTDYIIDLIPKNAKVILVVKHYLGSINHTLLSILALKNKGFSTIGIIIVGEKNKYSEAAIFLDPKVKYIAHIPILKELNKDTIHAQAEEIKDSLTCFLKRNGLC